MLLIEARPALLLFEGVLDPARIRQGHAVELVDASCVGLYRQGDVDEALDVDDRDVAQADALDVLGLPAALELDAVLVDTDDGVVVAGGLRYGSYFQSLLRAARSPLLTPGYKTASAFLANVKRPRPDQHPTDTNPHQNLNTLHEDPPTAGPRAQSLMPETCCLAWAEGRAAIRTPYPKACL